MFMAGLKSSCYADNKLPDGSAFTPPEHDNDNNATLSRFFALIFHPETPVLSLSGRGRHDSLFQHVACTVSSCFDLRAGCEIKPQQDRATQGCDPSGCGRRRAGRGLIPFLNSPQPFFCVTNSAPADRRLVVISSNDEK